MERIQSAISKARAAREGKAPVPAERPEQPAASPEPVFEHSPASDASWAALPELAVLPRVLEHHRIVTHIPGPAATAFDVIRTRMLQQMRANGWKRIGITSPGPACGKTMALSEPCLQPRASARPAKHPDRGRPAASVDRKGAGAEGAAADSRPFSRARPIRPPISRVWAT